MIRFKYFLTGSGWALAIIGNGRTGMTVPASYLCDALGDFVEAVQSLFATTSTECAWEQEPGEVRWTFQRSGSRLSLRVSWKDGRETFTGDDDLLHFSGEVIRELDDLLATWGAEGYLKKWCHPFPQEAYQKLEQRIRSESERRRVEG